MSAKTEFVHLHNHSEYSLLDGLIRLTDHEGKPSEALKSLAQSGARGFAVTDHGNMFGAVEFYNHANAIGLNPIIGCEMYLAKGSRFDRGHSQKENCHLTVLARDFEGYQNLMQLSSSGFLEGYYYDPRIDRELLAKHSKGLIVLSGCLKSELSQLAATGDLAAAERLAAVYRDLLDPGCFFLEVMEHGIPEQQALNKTLLEIHKRTGIPLVVTNDCHYAKQADVEAHDARVCISTGKLLADPPERRLKFNGEEYYLKTAAQMHERFAHIPEALKNTLVIADMCRLELPKDQLLLPEFQVPPGHSQDSYMEELAQKGLRERLKTVTPSHEERLKYELSVIKRLGFSGYFLIVWDFIAFARREGIPVGPGRGSGAGALVAFALRITNLDPLAHNLLFERFLNPDRKSMPDLDIDFADTGRDRVIEYVRQKYGRDNVAQIITFGSLGAKLAVRDVGRVMGLPLAEVDKIAKMIPALPGTTLYETLQKNPDLQAAAKDSQIKKLLDLSMRLEGLKRHSSVHAAGTVITKEPVVRYAPLAKSPRSDVVTTQYDGDILPGLGLLKVDFLGLRTLTIIADAVALLRRRGRPDFDIDDIPPEDPKTFELLRTGQALAVFQLDSDGMRDLLFRLKPTTFNDIVALLALYRPGPMKAGMHNTFVDRKHGRQKISFEHPDLEPILKDTYGCIVFQEQVMEISKVLGGFTPGEADTLRKAMGKKNPEDFKKMREHFVQGAAKRKIAPKLANKIYDQLLEFGGYGFNKSHTAAYGLVAYQTAYLKANHPLEFMCAVATSEIGHSAVGATDKENKLVTYLEEARRMGLNILPPDAQRSEAAFSIEGDGSIRFGLVAVKNVGQGAADSIVAARRQGPFKDLHDLLGRIDLHAANKKVIESLTKAGALDSLAPGASAAAARGRLLAGIDEAVGLQARAREDLARGQGQLFSLADLPAAPPPEEGSPSAALGDNDMLKYEREVLGFYFSGHPLLKVREELRAACTHEIEELSPQVTAPVRIGGMVSQVKRLITKSKGEQWARAILEDLTGELTMLVFPKAYASGLGARLVPGTIVVAGGKLSFNRPVSAAAEGEGPAELIVEDLMPLEAALARYARRLLIACRAEALDEAKLAGLQEALAKHPGRCPVTLEQETAEGVAVLDVDCRVRLDQNLLQSIESILGPKSWRIESASS